ncbi:3-oxoacyl-ACP reductase [Algimonas ampicilliniresistens]|uniref:3-oxoacyl-ACP reductase n=1 Tax=Algimonas ampicilliniresistens TaxID=1298735 RepID=A0ABQ5VAK0_9PROT|nr:SDR family oxidoreductase [Algimonas ampicilliniresistens]GLQ24556.1 3-oxoacyl-ACP reductase [Algimonas ampicilliniresistens]
MRDPFSPFTYDLSDRVVLVTGASSGLGARMAKVLATHGAKVALAARRVDRLAQLQRDIEDHGGTAFAVNLDVASEEQTIAAYDAVEAALGPVNTVIANAGIARDLKRATDNPPEDFDTTYAVNLRGVFLTAREGAKRMMAAGSKQSEHGRIVLISSITSFDISPHSTFYSATKAGVSQMGRVLAYDWARMGINVNMIAPGYIQTEINDGLFETDYGRSMLAKWPRRRVIDADALDSTVLFLCSDHSRQITGTVTTVDDGQSLS